MNNNPNLKIAAIISSVLALMATCANAQNVETKWSVGGGVAYFSAPFKGAKNKTVPLPYIGYEGEKFSASILGLSYRVFGDENFSVSAIASPRFQLIDPKDSTFMTGMSKRKSSVDIGVSAALKSDFGAFNVDIVTDALSVHKGSQVSANYTFPFEVGKLGVMPSVGVTWQSSKLADYYYGVRANEVKANRAKYVVGDATIPNLGLKISYPVKENIDLVSINSFEFLPKDITRNSIIDKKTNIGSMLAVIYKF
ncbi:MAG: MipA/OmpV family protein [Caulobacterales bacterium]|nr:MipA/OmpV family protein [Caulobacterales bacterium]MCA0371250.1 MipA/OmpV family protein [Pseudomonadota bacterium]